MKTLNVKQIRDDGKINQCKPSVLFVGRRQTVARRLIRVSTVFLHNAAIKIQIQMKHTN